MNINKILFLFLSVMALSIFGLWQLAHTEKFGKFLSTRLQATLLKNFDGKVSFDSIDIGLLPLATRIKNFSLEAKTEKGNNVYCRFDEVGFYFGLLDLLSSKLSIDKVILENGFIEYDKKRTSQDSSRERFRIEKFFSQYKNTQLGNMVQIAKTIQIKNTDLDGYVDVDDLRIRTYKNYLVFIGDLRRANVSKLHDDFEDDYENVYINWEVGRGSVRVKDLEIKDELELIGFKGEVEERGQEHFIKGDLHYQGRLKKVLRLTRIIFPRSDEFTGYVDVDAKISGNIKDVFFNVNFQGERVKTPYFVADDIQGNFNVSPERVVVNKVKLKRDVGVAELLEPVEVFDRKEKRFVPWVTRFQLNNFFTNEVFLSLDFLDTLKGRISGIIEVDWTKDKTIFSVEKGLYVKDFRLDSKDGDIPILKNRRMVFNAGRFVSHRRGGVDVAMDTSFPGCRFRGKGTVNDRGIDFLIDNSKIDFLGLGKVLGVQLQGKGDFKMHVVGPYDDTWFNFDVNLDDFEIAEYKFKNIVGRLEYSLENRYLYLKDIRSDQKISRLAGSGEMSFKERTVLNLNVKAERLSLEESYFLAAPVFNPIKEKFKNVKMRYSGNMILKFDFDKDRAESKGNIYTEEVSFYTNEYVDELSSQFSYKNKKMTFDNIEVKKGKGLLTGRLEINTARDYFKYQAKLSNLEVRDIYLYQLSKLQYKGRIFGESHGEGTPKRYKTKTILEAKRGSIGRKKVKNGKLVALVNQDRIKMEGNFLGDIAKFESNLNWNKGNSYFKGEVDVPDIGILAGLLSRRNISNKAISGHTAFYWNISFDMASWKIINVDLGIKDFAFKYGQLALDLVEGRDEIIVKNSDIKKWNIGIVGKNNFLTSVGEGNFLDDFEINQEFKLDASLTMLLNSRIENAYGDLLGRHIVAWEKNKIKNDIRFESKDAFFKLNGLADSFSKVKFKVSLLDQRAVLEKFSSVFGDGVVTGKGHVVLNFPYPTFDINFKMENSKISFFKRSGVVASADVYLKGEKLPYVIDGKVSILHGTVKDEIKDMLKKFSTLKSHNRYAPQRNNNNVFRYLNYDLDVNILGPVSVANSLLDVKVGGGSKIGGSLDAPLLDGKFNIVRGASRIMFKNHDFIINEGSLIFSDSSGDKTPAIKLVGTVDVDEYKIKLNVFGDVESTQVELSSVPLLPQQDILSLLALGVTTGMDKDLDEKDRQSITTLSFGSLVVEQLKLHEGLTSSLGLRLSVQPEFQESQSGPLKGRLDKKDSSEKVKTATKLKVQKKISNNVDLSLSSTLGDAAEQKQIMNIIYKVNKNLSLEGIYEINASDVEAEESLNSGGIDIKYRISF